MKKEPRTTLPQLKLLTAALLIAIRGERILTEELKRRINNFAQRQEFGGRAGGVGL